MADYFGWAIAVNFNGPTDSLILDLFALVLLSSVFFTESETIDDSLLFIADSLCTRNTETPPFKIGTLADRIFMRSPKSFRESLDTVVDLHGL